MLDGMINGTYDDLKYIVMFIVVVMDICCGDDSAGGAAATPQLHVVLVVVLGFRFHLFFLLHHSVLSGDASSWYRCQREFFGKGLIMAALLMLKPYC